MTVKKQAKLINTRLHLVQSFYGQYFHNELHYKYFLEAARNSNIVENDFIVHDDFLNNFLNIFENNPPKNLDYVSEFLQKNWTIDKIELLLQAILTLASFEIEYLLEENTKLIIDDYVSITAMFYNQKEIGFVNGVLDKIAKKLRPNDFKLAAT